MQMKKQDEEQLTKTTRMPSAELLNSETRTLMKKSELLMNFPFFILVWCCFAFSSF